MRPVALVSSCALNFYQVPAEQSSTSNSHQPPVSSPRARGGGPRVGPLPGCHLPVKARWQGEGRRDWYGNISWDSLLLLFRLCCGALWLWLGHREYRGTPGLAPMCCASDTSRHTCACTRVHPHAHTPAPVTVTRRARALLPRVPPREAHSLRCSSAACTPPLHSNLPCSTDLQTARQIATSHCACYAVPLGAISSSAAAARSATAR